MAKKGKKKRTEPAPGLKAAVAAEAARVNPEALPRGDDLPGSETLRDAETGEEFTRKVNPAPTEPVPGLTAEEAAELAGLEAGAKRLSRQMFPQSMRRLAELRAKVKQPAGEPAKKEG